MAIFLFFGKAGELARFSQVEYRISSPTSMPVTSSIARPYSSSWALVPGPKVLQLPDPVRLKVDDVQPAVLHKGAVHRPLENDPPPPCPPRRGPPERPESPR